MSDTISDINSVVTKKTISIDVKDFDQMSISFNGTQKNIYRYIKGKNIGKLSVGLQSMLEKPPKKIDIEYVKNTGLILSKLLMDPDFESYSAIFFTAEKEKIKGLLQEFQNIGRPIKLPEIMT
mgnify:FL=1